MASEGSSPATGVGGEELDISDLERAEDYLVDKVLGNALNVVKHLSSCSADDKLTADADLLAGFGKDFLKHLDEIRGCVAKHIPGLNNYIPFEKTAYGAIKDKEIAEQKIKFAIEHLKYTSELFEKALVNTD
mmetsp:Transcript_17563/g.21614  ORF Transcript_17563/g.21614 Transcript_17563/m.21614 type:complete len:132 (+) Transcript_17563:69-464(+)